MTARRPRPCWPRPWSSEGLRNVAAGAAPVALKRGIDTAVDAVSEQLLEDAREVEGKEEIAHVATISAQDRAIGELIAEAFDKVGKDGVITVEESTTTALELEFTEGMQFDKGYISPYFVTDPERMEAVLEDAYVLHRPGQDLRDQPTCCRCWRRSLQAGKPLFIVAEDVDGEALSTLVVNKIRGTFTAVAVKAPGFGDRRKAMLQDIAILTGAQVVSPEVGLKLDQVGLEVLGTARRIVVTKDNTTIVDGGGDARPTSTPGSQQIKAEIERTDSDWDREKLQERLAKLAGGVCVIKVGAHTEVELKEKKHRIEDAVSATRAAIEEGIVAGGGSALRPRRVGARRRPRPRPATRRPASASSARRPSSRCAGSPRTPASEGYVVVDQGPRAAGRPGPQRRDRRVRRPHRRRRHRPGQGHPLGAAQRRVDRGDAAHHRDAGRREEGAEPETAAGGHGHGHGHGH